MTRLKSLLSEVIDNGHLLRIVMGNEKKLLHALCSESIYNLVNTDHEELIYV